MMEDGEWKEEEEARFVSFFLSFFHD